MSNAAHDVEATLERHRRARGDSFWEYDLLMAYPKAASAASVGLSAYVHAYEGARADLQVLSVQMRELIATVLLTGKGHERFAANHVRKLYRLGVTNAVIVEAFLAAAPALGPATMVLAMAAIHRANDPGNLEGALPPGGEPKTLVEFPEMRLGREVSTALSPDLLPGADAVWQYAARIDPVLQDLARRYYDNAYALSADPADCLLPAATRHLVAIPALSWRGAVELAADHCRRATRLGVSAKQIVAALGCGFPMTGLTTVEVGLRAMMLAGVEP